MGLKPGRSIFGGQENSNFPFWASLAKSIKTGPGRPVVAISYAAATTPGMSSARVTKKLCLVIGIVIPTMSAS